jgi:hypothetical protein
MVDFVEDEENRSCIALAMEMRFDEVFGKSNIDLVSNISAKISFNRFMKEVFGSALYMSRI